MFGIHINFLFFLIDNERLFRCFGDKKLIFFTNDRDMPEGSYGRYLVYLLAIFYYPVAILSKKASDCKTRSKKRTSDFKRITGFQFEPKRANRLSFQGIFIKLVPYFNSVHFDYCKALVIIIL